MPATINYEDLTKRYYSISEVAALFNISKSAIRYWESEFTHLKPHKNGKGERKFTVKNIEEFELIYSLIKEKGFTIQGAKKEIKNQKKRIRIKKSIINDLENAKKFFLKLKETLDKNN